jgi:hypothetical protein
MRDAIGKPTESAGRGKIKLDPGDTYSAADIYAILFGDIGSTECEFCIGSFIPAGGECEKCGGKIVPHY